MVEQWQRKEKLLRAGRTETFRNTLPDGSHIRDDLCDPGSEGKEVVCVIEEHHRPWPIVESEIGQQINRFRVQDDDIEIGRSGADFRRRAHPGKVGRQLKNLTARLLSRANNPIRYRFVTLSRNQNRVLFEWRELCACLNPARDRTGVTTHPAGSGCEVQEAIRRRRGR